MQCTTAAIIADSALKETRAVVSVELEALPDLPSLAVSRCAALKAAHLTPMSAHL
jgi:hypothetical protein